MAERQWREGGIDGRVIGIDRQGREEETTGNEAVRKGGRDRPGIAEGMQ